MISCRAISEEGEALTHRRDLDTKLAQLKGVEFLVSCVTGLRNNSKSANDEPEEVTIRKGVAYFIVTKSESIEDEIRRTVYDGGFKNQVTYIRPRNKSRDSLEKGLRELKQVVKVRLNVYAILFHH